MNQNKYYPQHALILRIGMCYKFLLLNKEFFILYQCVLFNDKTFHNFAAAAVFEALTIVSEPKI